ncbi:MAG: RNA polymerase sigma-54 factor [Dethiobacter sp.]|jgi:RNA polymerase sigma-54 factor|nr:MAG: RNA polymerase sigma-54 factor [Dethiobacter sp.]
MVMNFELKIEQSQKIVMTLELQQAIALLQLSALELLDYIQEEVINNPVLEIQEKEENDFETEKTSDNNPSNPPENGSFEWEEYFNEFEPFYSRDKIEFHKSTAASSLDYFACQEKNLQEHLTFQLKMSLVSGKKYLIGEYLIGNLDSNGYLQGEVTEHARFLGVDDAEILKALELIQTFEPCGVGARTLQECLLLQLREHKDVHSFAKAVIEGYLPELARGRYREIAHKLGISMKELQEAVDFIRTLNPKPGAYLSGAGDVRYIIPDVIVEKVEGEYVIIINDNIPHLFINPFYQNLVRCGCEESVNSFIKKRLDSALWLLRSIEQRRLTLYKVTEQIIKIQKPFLEKGIYFLKPLTLKDVADKIGIHESTVSRATTNKYVQTPRGLYSLKFFFSSSIGGLKGEVYSALSIKAHLKELIEEEKHNSPYSDQQIKELLEKRGIQLSRRTITKYRKEMGIPASSQRRRI